MSINNEKIFMFLNNELNVIKIRADVQENKLRLNEFYYFFENVFKKEKPIFAIDICADSCVDDKEGVSIYLKSSKIEYKLYYLRNLLIFSNCELSIEYKCLFDFKKTASLLLEMLESFLKKAEFELIAYDFKLKKEIKICKEIKVPLPEDKNMNQYWRKEKEMSQKKLSSNFSPQKYNYENIINNDYLSSLLNKIRKLHFEGFVHTTELNNFLNIVESGYLYPRRDLNEEEFVDKANQNVINNSKMFRPLLLECCRFYYYFKTPTNYRANYERPVAIVFDEKIIEKYYPHIYFTNGNATCYNTKWTKDILVALEFNWDKIFDRKRYGTQDPQEKKEITRIRNAEFLVNRRVSIKFIKTIYFKNVDDMKEASLKVNNKDIIEKFKFAEKGVFDYDKLL